MGVAGLFSFLRRRYPEIVEACAQQGSEVAEGESGCDNLYIDLNHILHACTHPSWREQAHVSEVEQFMEVDVYLDRLVALMRPTRLLLVAADGSAPTAKMNQQRGRRFYSAHQERQRREVERQVRREMAAEMGPTAGADIPPLPAFDGNVITPGTAFMSRLAAHLRTFFRQKLGSDPDWASLAVIFSDSSEPGEGEHKIMRFIRQQRTQPDYDPNTRHAIYGQDADLILLGLLSHEPHFVLLRESGTLEIQEGNQGEEEEEGGQALWSPVGQQPLELLRLSTLRDFLRCEFSEFCEEAPGAGQQAGAAAAAAAQAPEGSEAVGGFSGPAVGSGSGGSQRGSLEGVGARVQAGAPSIEAVQGDGELDLITGEKKQVHPSVGRRLARKQQKLAAKAATAAAASAAASAAAAKVEDANSAPDSAESTSPRSPPASGGDGGLASGSGSGAGSGSGGASGGGAKGASHSFERILDDVVFCTFLAGNDFLPHVPSLDIYDRPSALETLLDRYKELLGGGSGGRKGYLTNSGRVDADKLCWLFQRLGAEEEANFQQRELRKVREQRRKVHQEAAAGGGGGTRDRPGGAGWMSGGSEWVSVGELRAGESLDEVLISLPTAGNGEGLEGLPDGVPLYAGDPASLRRELLRRVRGRMDDRAQAGMAADRVRLSLPGYRSRYYQRCFGAEAAGGPELEKLVRRVCSAFCRTLVWTLAYYCRGNPPVALPGGSTGAAAGIDAACARGAASSGRRGKGDEETPYASWQVFYAHHYAPLASDLAKYGKEALKGAVAAASRADAPIPPFAQLLSVLPFSSMPACLPAALAQAAEDPSEGLAALHGAAGAEVFPEDVSALVDLSGKKWAHTAVITLPFPDVDAITQFVQEQLDQDESKAKADGSASSEEEEGSNSGSSRHSGGCSRLSGDGGSKHSRHSGGTRLVEEERARNRFAPSHLYLSAFHPLAPRLLSMGGQPGSLSSAAAAAAGGVAAGRGAGTAEGRQVGEEPEAEAEAKAEAEAEAGADVVDGSSILSLLLQRPPLSDSSAGGDGASGDPEAVLCLPLDLAGQDVTPFSPGLLPGTEEGERAVTLQSWSKRKVAAQRRQLERLRGGRGRGREGFSGRGFGGGRGRGLGRGSSGAFLGTAGSGGRGGAAAHAVPLGGGVHLPPPPVRGAGLGGAGRALPVPPPPSAVRQQQQQQQQPQQQQQQQRQAYQQHLCQQQYQHSWQEEPPYQQSYLEQQQVSDEEMARRLQQQFDAEARAERLPAAASAAASSRSGVSHAPASLLPPPVGLGSFSAGSGGGLAGASFQAPVPPPPAAVAAADAWDGWEGGAASPAGGVWADEVDWEDGEAAAGEAAAAPGGVPLTAACQAAGGAATGAAAAEQESTGEAEEELMPWLLVAPAHHPDQQPAGASIIAAAASAMQQSRSPARYLPLGTTAQAPAGRGPVGGTAGGGAGVLPPSAQPAGPEDVPPGSGDVPAGSGDAEVDDMLAMMGIQ